MSPARSIRAFTIAEMMIAIIGSMIVLGALLLSSTQLQRALYSSERYAAKQTEQRRMIDYLGRDLRRAIGLSCTTTAGGTAGTRLAGATITVEKGTALLMTLPGYYQSQSPDDPTYDEALPVVVANNYVDYGSTGGPVEGVRVLFRKVFLAAERCECFVRVEEEVQTVIVRNAENLHLQVGVSPDGRTCTIDVTFNPSTRGLVARVSTRDQILMRNIRND
jgi:hypothetical protein